MSAAAVTNFDTVKVASIFPLERSLHKPGFHPKSIWTTPGVKKGSPPAIIEFGPSWENVFRGGATDRDPRGIVTQENWSGLQVANDFIKCHFIIGLKDGGLPGLWVVGHLDTEHSRAIQALNDEVDMLAKEERDFDRQSTLKLEIADMEKSRWVREVAHATRHQTIFFENWFNWAESLAANGKRDDIIEGHRIAAEWIGAKGRSWQKEPGREALKDCPYCFTPINMQAVICAHCTRVIDPVKYARMQNEESDVMAKRVPPPNRLTPKRDPVAV